MLWALSSHLNIFKREQKGSPQYFVCLQVDHAIFHMYLHKAAWFESDLYVSFDNVQWNLFTHLILLTFC